MGSAAPATYDGWGTWLVILEGESMASRRVVVKSCAATCAVADLPGSTRGDLARFFEQVFAGANT
jgi:hypothetical protein